MNPLNQSYPLLPRRSSKDATNLGANIGYRMRDLAGINLVNIAANVVSISSVLEIEFEEWIRLRLVGGPDGVICSRGDG